MSLKYKEFYHEGKIIPFEETIINNGRDMDPKYDQNRIFCPECHAARLSFYGCYGDANNRAHLKTDKSTPHLKGCSYSYEPASSMEELAKYYKTLTQAQIETKVEAYIHRMMRKNEAFDADLEPDNNIMLMPSTDDRGRRTYRRVLRMNVNDLNNVKKKYYGIPILFDGFVKLRVDENKGDFAGTYILNLINIKTNQRIRYFPRRSYHDLVNENKKYYFVVIAVCAPRNGYPLYSIKPIGNSIRYTDV